MERRHKGQTWRLTSDSWVIRAREALGQILLTAVPLQIVLEFVLKFASENENV